MIVVCTIVALFAIVALISKANCSVCPPPPTCQPIPEWAKNIDPSAGIVLRPSGDLNNIEDYKLDTSYAKHLDNIYLKPGSTFELNNTFVERGKIGCAFSPAKSAQCSCTCQNIQTISA